MNVKENLEKGKVRAKMALVKVGLAATTVLTIAQAAKADITTDMSNGTAVIQAGIAVASTPPLGYVVSGFAVGIGALVFVKVVRRFM